MLFVEDVIAHHFAWVGGALTLVAVFEIAFQKKVTIRAKSFFWAAVALLFISCCQAWFDEHRNVTTLIGEKSALTSVNKQLQAALLFKQTPIQVQLPVGTKVHKSIPTIQLQSSGTNSPNTAVIGNNNQVTVGKVEPPSRKLTAEQNKELETRVAAFPSRILILYPMGDTEAYALAKQIGDAVEKAGWKLKQPPSAAVYYSSGAPQTGLQLSWKGPTPQPNEQLRVSTQTSQGALAASLMSDFPKEFHALPGPDYEDGLLILDVFPNPQSAD